MRKYIIPILLLANLLGFTNLYADDTPKAFFIYRNDGQFNAFFNDEIDSISFSNIDADSIWHDEIVMQEIWMTDSVCRIPIAAIDSVGFQELPTIYKEGVVSLDADLWSYIMSTDSTAVHLYKDTPKQLIPQVGTKVVSLQTCDFFPFGFSGKVNTVVETDSCFTLNCEWIDPVEVLEQYYCVENTTTEQTITRASDKIRELPEISLDITIPDLPVKSDDNWSYDIGTRFEANLTIEPSIYIIHNIIGGQRFATGKLYTTTSKSIGASIYGSLEWGPDLEKYEKDLFSRPIPYVPFISFYGKGVPSISISGEMAVGFSYNKKLQHTYHFQWSTDRNIKNTIGLLGAPINLNEDKVITNFLGEIEFNANYGIEFGLCFLKTNKVLDAKLFIKPEIGIDLNASLNLPISVLEREPKKKTAKYELIKESDSGISSNIYVKISAGYEVSFLDLNDEPAWGLEDTPIEATLSYPLFERDIFPTFENIDFDKETLTLKSDITDKLIMPTNVGFKIYDKEGKEVYKKLYEEKQYKNPDSFKHYEIKIDDISKILNKQCTVYPYLTFLTYDIPALPPFKLGLGVFPITEEVSDMSHEEATLLGHLKNEDNLPFTGNVGFLFGTDEVLETFGTKCNSTMQSDLKFSFDLSSLKAETTYYYCAFLEMNDSCYYGETLSFTTLKEPAIKTISSTNVTSNSAKLNGYIEFEGDYSSATYGMLYGTSSALTYGTSLSVTSENNDNGSFSATVHGLSEETEYYFRAYLYINDKCYYGDVLSFTTGKAEEIVDLGLSVYWRGWNVGATTSEEYGNYYAWGEATQSSNFAWDNYFDNPYDADENWIGCQTTTDITSTDKDAANTVLGNGWRMPTHEEMSELMNNCTWTWTTTANGVSGYEVRSNVEGYTDKAIFLPAAGNGDKEEIKNVGTYGGYWTSTPLESTSKAAAYNLYFYGATIHAIQNSNRYTGRSIRPVMDK